MSEKLKGIEEDFGGTGKIPEIPGVGRKRSERADARAAERSLDTAYQKLASTVAVLDTEREQIIDSDVLNRQYFAKDEDSRSDKIVEVRSGFVDNGKVSGDKIVVRNIDEEAFLRDYKETGVIKHFEEEKIKTPKELKSECIVIIKELKTKYGVNVNEDGTVPAGFLGMNRKKVLNLEEKNPDFASKTEKLVALNREIDMINNPKANVRVESNIDKRQLPKSGGNVLTGN
ncbi:MAG: hypothetical protein ACD_18C00341G0004 [uncultured bacterium]|nr:MAG: hypothetical protein ACD_18C00341G0004 [uncultured bacterium]OGH84210.1 MAG: hypothetical protein A2488_02440 [Candidatus Magasanikbacteria bacterium RIFOXYC12_FULL_32_21b]OGH90207.1 MAG: hypothetical protein A2507_03995 [Candidatus Magasanikbacteria bacterium RIFOXYD12_FULL_33_17]HAO52199.1 hypothetical protein [Candidatus Magasanikbacteria bacterium]